MSPVDPDPIFVTVPDRDIGIKITTVQPISVIKSTSSLNVMANNVDRVGNVLVSIPNRSLKVEIQSSEGIQIIKNVVPIFITATAAGVKGEKGDKGDKGDTGDPGPAGGDLAYIHTQSVAAASWPITHNLGKYPSVSVVDTGDSVIIPDVQYIDLNQVSVLFGSATSGRAYLN